MQRYLLEPVEPNQPPSERRCEMNTINMPGFAAEASLYKTSGHYRAMAGTSNDLAGSRGVLPQLPRQIELLQCLGECDFNADRADIDICRNVCFWNDFRRQIDETGGGGGGGGEPSDCVLCLRGCARKPTSQRPACRRNCYELFCTQ
jgi:hypothetical protein